MLVLRKEIKIGIAAGLAIVGIAGVYGLLATVSSSGTSANKDNGQLVSDDQAAARKKAIESAVAGLPEEDKTAVTPVTPGPTIATGDTAGHDSSNSDPFAESRRTDGNVRNDVWSSALSTGRVRDVTDTTPKMGNDDTLIIKAPTPPAKSNSPLARVDDAKSNVDPLPPQPTNGEGVVVDRSRTDTYKVQAGDTFSTIAAKVYGSKKYYAALQKANPDVNPSRMKIGQEISVPPKEHVATAGGAVAPEPAKLAAPIDASRQYRVAPGDTLSRIGQKLYGKSTMWQAIYETNKAAIGPDEAKLKVGTVLDLPQKPAR